MATVNNDVLINDCPATPVYIRGSDISLGDLTLNGDVNVRPYFHEIRCDAIGTEFIRVYTIDTATGKASVACDILIDGTAYTAVEPTVRCPERKYQIVTTEWCAISASQGLYEVGDRIRENSVFDVTEVPSSKIETHWENATTGIPLAVVDRSSIGKCEDENENCDPWVASFFAGAMPPIQPFNSLAIHKPDCCVITVTTDAGTVTLGETITQYAPDTFKCNLSTLRINGDCLDQVQVFLQRTG